MMPPSIESLKNVIDILSPYITGLLMILIGGLLGGLVAKGIQIAVTTILRAVQLDAWFEKMGWDVALRRDLRKSPSELAGAFFYWLVVLTVFVGLFVWLGHPTAVTLFHTLLSYITVNVMAALFVLVLSVLFGRLIAGVFQFVGTSVGVPAVRTLTKAIYYVIVIFGIVFSLEQLGIPMADVLKRLDILVGSIALGAAIAFGLGCKDLAGDFLSDFFRQR